MADRTIEDRLREEYFELLPEIGRVRQQLESEIRYYTRLISSRLDKYQRLQVTSRVKECGSAVDALRRRQESRIFDPGRADSYTLSGLRDLAGVRILAFPQSLLIQIDQELRQHFLSWKSDPVRAEGGETLAYKYYGYCGEASSRVQGEYQVVPMLTGLFWEIEHDAIYKPDPELKGIAESLEMRERTGDVLKALQRFEDEFERLLRERESST